MSSDESEIESADGEEIELDVPDLEAPDFDPYRQCCIVHNAIDAIGIGPPLLEGPQNI